MAEDETLTLPDGTTATPLEAAIGASPQEVNPQTGKPYVHSAQARERHSAAAKRAWATRRAANRSGPVEPPDASELEAAPPLGGGRDRPPGGRGRRRSKAGADEQPREARTPAFRAGPIAKGMNSLYARTGKFVRVWDADIGGALIAMARKESDDDTTVGEAWEELARTNPRVRAFLLRLIEGGAWGQLMMAHMPLVMAVLLKDAVRRRVPLMRVLGDVLADDEEGPASFPTGLTQGDLEQAMSLAAEQFGLMMDGRVPGMPRQPTVDGDVL